jgi:hypothetical protein
LEVLVEEVRAPAAARAEVDALLAGLSLPLASGASPRERADLLLALMGDEQVADYTGTDGRTVRTAAIQALIALGYPYALEVPPEALEAKARDEAASGPGLLSTGKGQLGLGLVALSGILQLLPVLYAASTESWSSMDTIVIVALAIITGTTFLPALVTVLGHNVGSRGLKTLGIVWLTIASILWIAPGILSIGAFPFNLIPLALGGLILGGSRLMAAKS